MGIISQKHTNFVKEPMKDKPVKDLAGIGKTYEKRLAAVGFDKAYVLLGQFLVLKKNEERFVKWLMQDMTCDTTAHNAKQCYKCLNDWCEAFL